MTPKEKATQLIYAFEAFTDRDNEYEFAKQCAAIAVDEILFSNNTIFETNIPHECWKYWIEVKQELQDEERNN